MNIRGPNWRDDCPRCVASKFTCDEHYRPVPVARDYRDKSGCQYCDGYCHGGCREGDYS
jgi:hypothetical protein